MLTYKTETSWRRPLNSDEMALVNAKLAELISQTKTDGVRHEISGLTPDDGPTIERHWATEEDAQAWIDFFKDFDPPMIESKISAL